MPLAFIRRGLLSVGLALFATAAPAQDYPSKPITLMVGLAAGGITDITARLYAEAVSKSIGQRVTVENKTGAGGGVAAAYVQNATPDGYTLLVFSGSQHATVPAVSNANYDPVKGFSPITYLFNAVVVLTVPAQQPGQDHGRAARVGPQEAGRADGRHAGTGLAVASARRQDSAHGQGAVGDGALSRRRADDVRSDHRPRRYGVADAVDVTLLSRRGQAPGAGARRRHALGAAAGCADLVELGYAKERVASWFALAGPAGMPPALVAKIRDIFIKASKDPELQRRLTENGTPIVSSTPEEMGRAMAAGVGHHAGAGEDAESPPAVTPQNTRGRGGAFSAEVI